MAGVLPSNGYAASVVWRYVVLLAVGQSAAVDEVEMEDGLAGHGETQELMVHEEHIASFSHIPVECQNFRIHVKMGG